MAWGGLEETQREPMDTAHSLPLKARRVLGLRADNGTESQKAPFAWDAGGGQKRRRPEWGSSTPPCSGVATERDREKRPRGRGSHSCGGASAFSASGQLYGRASPSPVNCTGGGAGWFAQAPTMIDPATHDLAPYEAAAAGLVICDKAFRRLRWAVSQMAGHHRSHPPIQMAGTPARQHVPAVQLVELLREGWGGVLMTSAQARQLRDILAVDSANEPREVDPDVHYALCCRVVDWWNLPLSYSIQGNLLDGGAAAAVEAYTIGRRLPPRPECKSLVAEMAEHSASVERQLAKCAQPAPWSWNATPGVPVRQLGLGEASAALDSSVHGRVGEIGAVSEDSTDMPLSQGSDMSCEM